MNSAVERSLMADLAERLSAGEYAGYAYAYPHKSAYRPFSPPVALRDAWASEDRQRLFLYTHLPFCEVRCGFCNLFTSVRPEQSFTQQTLRAILTQAEAVAAAIRPERVTQAAFGGGTPSFLSAGEIEWLFHQLAARWPVDWRRIPVSFETSPATVDEEKLSVLRDLGVSRLSIGVQSFVPEELKALGRPQRTEDVERACRWIRDASFPVFNLDLIYGASGQTLETWLESLRRAIDVGPDEVYLYPLYVRELTGLAKAARKPSEHRRELYRAGRDLLLAAGFTQQSMRLFRSAGLETREVDYCCQDDGMIGLGPGARSYTRSLHYSSEYAVGQVGVRRIIAAFNERERYDVADYGAELDTDEQRRRFVIKSLLRKPGLCFSDYAARFGSDFEADFAEVLAALGELRLAARTPTHVELTALGLEHSDTIGPWLYSPRVQRAMADCELT